MKLFDFELRYRLGEGEWQTYGLSHKEILIGRGADNDLVLDHRAVSRHHLRLRFQDDAFQIIDLESSNGSRLDGEALIPQNPTAVSPGQVIEIGDFSLVLEESDEDRPHIVEEKTLYIIRYRFGSGNWQSFPLEHGETVLGRDPECDFMLNDSDVSRQHARVRMDDRGIWLADLDSTNGTKVEGVALVPQKDHPLQLRQIFSVGNFLLQVDDSSLYGDATSSRLAERSKGDMDESMQTILDAEVLMLPSVPIQPVNLMSRERVTLGRAVDNDIVLNHPLVNRHHAIIERSGTRFRIQDLRSTNGVFVYGKRIERETLLKDWDHIKVCAFDFVLSGQDLEVQVAPGLKLEAQNIDQKVSKSRNLLQEISLIINPNDFVAFVGMSGSGKSTLLNALSGYWPASHGKVLINDNNLYQHYDLFRNDIGFVPQNEFVHTELTPDVALNYIAKLRMPSDISRQERKTVVEQVLEELDLVECRRVPISRLSCGQIKRVSLGCELLTKPRLLYLDELTSGLDPGTEYDTMRLLRRLADQGRTVLLIMHATKNVHLCDKVVFLARNGNMAFFGTPEDALSYFDQYRTDRERREKEMDFDDIFRILNDETRGAPPEWRERYLNSQAYYKAFGIDMALVGIQEPQAPLPTPKAERLQNSAQRVSGLRQFLILSARNMKILARDKISLALMLMPAPVLAMMDFIWGSDLYDPVRGDASKIITLWFIGALVTILVGALSSLREIVKEVDIYKHERAFNLRIVPYILSKVWVGLVFGLYQAAVLMAFRYYFVQPNLPSLMAFIGMYITFFLGIMIGCLIGLLISAVAPNQNYAMVLLIVVFVFQFLFAGVLLPLDLIPGGQQISFLMPTRWTFEAFVRITGLGGQLTHDPCWNGFDKGDRQDLSIAVKEICPCMGASIFTECADFPGILSPGFFDEAAQIYLSAEEPIEPAVPTPIAYPTAIAPPTPLPTPTLLPSLTPYPTPRSSEGFLNYLEKIREQDEEFQAQVSDQFEGYRLDSISQGETYAKLLITQGNEYIIRRDVQVDDYADSMQVFGDQRAAWQESRDKAIGSAEVVLGSLFDNYRWIFNGSVIDRWIIMLLIQSGLFILILVVQKRKDLS